MIVSQAERDGLEAYTEYLSHSLRGTRIRTDGLLVRRHGLALIEWVYDERSMTLTVTEHAIGVVTVSGEMGLWGWLKKKLKGIVK